MTRSVKDISKSDCNALCEKIKGEIYKPAYSYKITIFICGADINKKNSIRYRLIKLFNHWLLTYKFDIIFPEDIFDELLYSSKSKDLLFLESILAYSVDAIIIIPESPGSFSELGAFANDDNLRKKIICIVDKKYKKNKSFINKGPIKLIKTENSFGVIYVDPLHIIKDFAKITTALNKMKKQSFKKSDTISLLQLENFILPSIYLLEPISKDTLINLVASATLDYKNPFQTATAALTILVKKGKIELTTYGYKLTTLGLNTFYAFQKRRGRIKRQEEIIKIDNLRLEVLNLKYRNKQLKV